MGENQLAMHAPSDITADAPAALRLRLDGDALAANYRWFAQKAGVPAIPAVKADGYGLGAAEVTRRLEAAGATAFAVSTWAEALALARALRRADLPLLVLHGFTADCTAAATALPAARPVLDTLAQCSAWATAFPGRPADLMVDTGMNRLGLAPAELPAAAGLMLDTVHSHLASADIPEDPMTEKQLDRFRAVVAATPGARHALANSAGICWGRDYSFDAVRPGLGLYGGLPHPQARVERVVTPQARVVQVRRVPAGETVGYGGTWTAGRDSRIAVLNIGYADGLPRSLQAHLAIRHDGHRLPLAGRISMDLIAVDMTGHDVAEGDWLALDFDLPALSEAAGVSQYELLVHLSGRFARLWT